MYTPNTHTGADTSINGGGVKLYGPQPLPLMT